MKSREGVALVHRSHPLAAAVLQLQLDLHQRDGEQNAGTAAVIGTQNTHRLNNNKNIHIVFNI